jgi:hypothetical protein
MSGLGNQNLQEVIGRAEEGEFNEYWLQLYIRDNYEKLGFDSLEGPFDIGYDFKGVYRGKRVVVEAETQSKNFLYHKHDPDEVDILIVLKDNITDEVYGMSPPEWRERLPKRIITVDPEDFVKSTHPMRKAYAIKKQSEREAFVTLLPFVRIKGALATLWDVLAGEVPYEGTPEAEAFDEALSLTAMEYMNTYDLNLEELKGKPVFTKIEVVANDLIRGRRGTDDLTCEEKEFLAHWLGVLKTEYSLQI